MFCTNCGAQLDDDIAFCPNCGTRIVKEENEEPKAEETKPEAPKAEEKKPEETKPEAPKAEEKKPEEIKAEAPKAEEKKPEETKPEAPKAEEKKPEETKAEAPKAEEKKPEETKPEAPKAEEKKPEETKPEAPKAEEKKPEEMKAEAPKAEEKKPEKKVKEPKRTKNGLHAKPSGGKAFGSFLLCIVLFLAVLAAGVILTFRMSFSEKQVNKNIDSLEISEITLPSSDWKEEVPLMDFLEQASGFNFEKTAGINKKDLAKLMGKDYVVDTFKEYLNGYLQYFMNGTEPKKLTRDEFVEFIQAHNDDILELTDFSFCYKDANGKQQVYTVDIDNAFKDLGTDEVTASWVEKKAGISFGPIKFALSIWGVVAFGALALVLIILLLCMHGKTMHSGISFVGMTLLLDGIVMDVAGGVGLIAKGKFHSNLISAFAVPCLINMLIIGSVVLVVGFLIYACGRKICDGVARKKQKKAQANA